MEIRNLAQIKKIGSAVLLILYLLGCAKEEIPERLDYTAWSGYNDAGVLRLLSFKPDNKVEEFTYLGEDPIKYEIRYRLDGDKITFIQATGTYATGIIDGEILTVDYGSSGVWILYKK